MTVDLYPTPSRIKLLDAVRLGLILDDPRDGHTYWAEFEGLAPYRVDARVREAERAGWIELDQATAINWRLTAAGTEVLRRARGGEAP